MSFRKCHSRMPMDTHDSIGFTVVLYKVYNATLSLMIMFFYGTVITEKLSELKTFQFRRELGC